MESLCGICVELHIGGVMDVLSCVVVVLWFCIVVDMLSCVVCICVVV